MVALLFSTGTVTYRRLAIAAAMVVTAASAAELRPSDHGLEYQTTTPPAPAGFPPEMERFFGYAPPPPPPVALPWEADTAANGTSWWRSISGADAGGGDHVRHVLVAVCSACGALGVLLLAVSLAMCLSRGKKETAPSCCVRGGVGVKEEAGKGNSVNIAAAAANSKVVPVIVLA